MEIDKLYTRVCPICSCIVTHKNKNKCNEGIKFQKPCVNCSRKSIGKANASTDICPICNETFIVSRLSQGQEHAQLHGLTAEELWLKKHNISKAPKCACGQCDQIANWVNWQKGYSKFILGHNTTVESEENKIKRLNALRESFSSGKSIGWSKGLTKDSDIRVLERGKKSSIGRRKAFAQGSISIWSKGLTKKTDKRINLSAKKLAQKYADGELIPWAKGLTKNTDKRIFNMAKKISISHKKDGFMKKITSVNKLTSDEIKQRVEDNLNLKFVDFEGEYNHFAKSLITIQCKSCNATWNDTVSHLDYTRCFNCDPGGSKTQNDILYWIKTITTDEILLNNRKIIYPSELDIYIPSKSFAIEFNGLYWHNILRKSSIYHQQKSEKCFEKNINLFHVFEDEWRDKKDIVKSFISRKLDLIVTKIDVKSCTIKELSKLERKIFFEENHFDGDTGAQLSYGLIYENKIVSAISLKKPFNKKYNDYFEIVRICDLKNVIVNNGFSKLIDKAKEICLSLNKSHLMMYTDFRFGSEKDMWLSLGWNFDKTTSIKWWWTDFKNRFNRFKFREDKERNMTESQVVEEAKVVKIYGCSNMLFTMKCT